MWLAFRSNLRARLTRRQFARYLPHPCPRYSEMREPLRIAQILFGYSELKITLNARTGRLKHNGYGKWETELIERK